MIRFWICVLGFLTGINLLCAQQFEWASEVVKVSSEYQDKDYGGIRVLGPPNSMTTHGSCRFAWAPSKESGGKEFVEVRFKNAIAVQQIVIGESLNPGSITKIELIDNTGKKHKVYEEKNPKASGFGGEAEFFRHLMKRTNYRAIGLRLTLNTKAVGGMNQIDCIGISSSRDQMKPEVNVLQYSNPVPPRENLGRNVNGQYPERLPIISPDGNTLYFARKLSPENIGGEGEDDIYVSQRMPGDIWSKARNVGRPLNNESHNFVISVSPDNSKIYLANDYKKRSRDGVSVARRSGGDWSKPTLMPIQNHYNKNEFVAYHVSVDGNTMVMAVERDEGLGDRDLYVSFKYGDGGWSEPKNLGPIINTPDMEASVFLAADNRTIYFSSAGHWGYGNLDVFMSRRLDETWTNWSTPVNLGKKINTSGMDYNYTIPASGEYAYFSSDYKTYGMSDLFRIRLPEEVRPEPMTMVNVKVAPLSPPSNPNQPIASRPAMSQDKPSAEELKYLKLIGAVDSPIEANDEGEAVVLVPQKKADDVQVELPGYFAVTEPADEQPEEIDYDGDDPEVLEEIIAAAPPPNPTRLKEQQNDIDDLQAKLNSLNFNISELETEVETAAISADDLDLPDLPPAPVKPTGQAKPLPQSEQAAPRPTPAPVEDDPELAALKAKFNQHNDLPPAEESVPTPKIETPPTPTTQEQTQQASQAPAPLTPPATTEDDAELAALKAKFNQHNDLPPADAATPEPSLIPPGDDQKPTSSQIPPGEDRAPTPSEIGPGKSQKPTPSVMDPGRDPERMNLGEPQPDNQPPRNQAQQPTTADIDVEAIRDEIQRDLTNDILNDVKADLKQSLLDDVRADLEKELENELEDDIRAELRDELKDQVEEDLRKDLKDQVANDLQPELRDEVAASLRDDMRPQVEEDLRKQIRDELAEQMRKDLEDQIRKDLTEQLRDPIKEELKKELELRLKKQLESKLRRELESKMRRQLKEREREAALAKSNPNGSQQPNAPERLDLNKDITLVPIQVGQIIPLNNIFFDANKYTLKKESFTELERALAFLKSNENLIVEVGGHTNGLCSHEFAETLSKGRSKTVKEYFVDNGIPDWRIQFRGYGKTVPIADNNSSAGRKKNQRVELKIIEIK